jgi:transposase
MPSYSKYPPETRERAVRMVAEMRSEYPSEGAAIAAAASICSIQSTDTLRKWVRSACSDTRCKKATTTRRNCTCKCSGAFHGSARSGGSKSKGSTQELSTQTRKPKTLRNVVVTVALVVSFGIAYLTVNGTLGGSASSGSSLSVQVQIDLDKILGALATALGLRAAHGPGVSTSGPTYHPDCADSATKGVKNFLENHHCRQFATATRTLVNTGITAQVAFSWIEMPTLGLATDYKMEIDAPGTGNPPGISSASFNGDCYASSQQGETVRTIWVRPTGDAKVDQEILQAAAQGKLAPSYLSRHCVN